ncbi:MAG: hypothetical protein ACKVP3_03170 [Hyphomicrobiaceae bacterium]
MTDHPRFWPARAPFEAACRDYHGGRLVHLVMRLVAPRAGRHTNGSAGDPMLAFDRALLDGERSPTTLPRGHRSAVRAAVIGIFAILFLSGLLQVLIAWKGTGGLRDSKVATSIRPGAR